LPGIVRDAGAVGGCGVWGFSTAIGRSLDRQSRKSECRSGRPSLGAASASNIAYSPPWARAALSHCHCETRPGIDPHVALIPVSPEPAVGDQVLHGLPVQRLPSGKPSLVVPVLTHQPRTALPEIAHGQQREAE
jgi:hypothetical protein